MSSGPRDSTDTIYLAVVLRACEEEAAGGGVEVAEGHTLEAALRADPAPACAKRWRGACAVLWARPADSLSAGIAEVARATPLGRWRGTWLQASCVSNAGSSVRVQPPLSLPFTVARASPKRLAWKVLSSRTFHDRRGGDAWNERWQYQCGLRGGWAALVAG